MKKYNPKILILSLGIFLIGIILISSLVNNGSKRSTSLVNNQNLNNYLNLSFSEYFNGNYQAAIDNCNLIIAFEPNLAQAYLTRALAENKLHKIKEAIQDLQKAQDLYKKQKKSFKNNDLSALMSETKPL